MNQSYLIGVKLKKDNLIQFAMLKGIGEDSELYKILDWEKVFYQPTDNELFLVKR